jgi:hypothetical protein
VPDAAVHARHLELLVEEPSMEAFLAALLPRVLPAGCSFRLHAFQGKADLLRHLDDRLRGYARWLPADWRLVVIVDRDDDDCLILKQRLESACQRAGLASRTRAAGPAWQVVTRLAIEELEAWYFGDWPAVRAAFPRVSARIPAQAAYRDPDGIAGGTWEALERILQRHGYFAGGLRKIELARSLGTRMAPQANRSTSWCVWLKAQGSLCQLPRCARRSASGPKPADLAIAAAVA